MSDYIEVTGSGAAASVPDLVVLDTRLSVEGTDVASALEGCSAQVAASLAAATAQGVADPDRHSTSIGVHPRWDASGQSIVGYTAFQTLRLVVRDRPQVGAVISALAAAAGNSFGLDSVTFSVSDTDALQRQSRAAAFKDAKSKAAEYAAHAGATLGPVMRVTESVDGARPMPKMFSREAADTASGSMPVEAGEATITSSVIVRFGLA